MSNQNVISIFTISVIVVAIVGVFIYVYNTNGKARMCLGGNLLCLEASKA
ncbi:MAG: hypothetical protein HY841_05620 [Bacteroidetes bacterium]|nr:hypothetical protein [Bacteroidota bacterium]